MAFGAMMAFGQSRHATGLGLDIRTPEDGGIGLKDEISCCGLA